jgi:tRNA modification GTPase
MDNTTIAAIATPSGSGGIGIVKMSGPEAVSIIKAIFRPCHAGHNFTNDGWTPSDNSGNNGFQSHRLNYGRIFDPQTLQVLDEVLVSVMRAPRTYTKEDVVEINAHGGSVALQTILKLALQQGACLAEPGEFTKRAFLNGRIDLTQAEAVMDIVNARTENALKIATAQIEGRLRKKVESIRQHLIQLLTHAEAAIDFPDEVDDIFNGKETIADVQNNVILPLEDLVRNYFDAHVFRDGLNVAVVGKPNVGKSSLLNRLLQKDRAIVTDIPGTTRDVIEDTININGIPVILSDTAGMHKTDDPVETIGIEKTIAHVNGSDLVLFLVEADHPLTDEDYRILDHVKTKPLIIVVNKVDLVQHERDIDLPDSWGAYDTTFISALYGKGIDSLKELIVKSFAGDNPLDRDETIVPNLRHKISLEYSLSTALDVVSELQNNATTEIIAINLQQAIDSLAEILGTNIKVDILDHIFSRFCIGK